MEDKQDLLPENVKRIANEALAYVQSHPNHQLHWQLRQKLYQSFGAFTDRKVKLARGWFAILAAQKVLPIFTSMMPYYSLPLQLLGTAIDELRWVPEAELSSYSQGELVQELLEIAYGTLGNELLEDRIGRTFSNTDMAATAAEKALREAKGWEDPFQHIEHFSVGTGANQGFMKLGKRTKNWQPLEQYSEETWAHLAAVGDTAGAAAIAYSCSLDSRSCDSDKLHEFWIWWLTEALPEAWNLASWDWVSSQNDPSDT